ncbi:MAG: Uma2 family endonuclease [Bryobacteraceae bacterium]
MGTSTLISLEEYLHTSYDPDCDYVDGELEDRNVGERDHSKLQIALSSYLYVNRKRLRISAYTEQRVRVSATRYRVPDICVTLGEPDEQVFTGPPFLCIEILSPEDRAARIHRKIADYLKFGVRYVWVINPRTLEAFIHTPSGMHAVEDGILRTSDPDIAVSLAEIFD